MTRCDALVTVSAQSLCYTSGGIMQTVMSTHYCTHPSYGTPYGYLRIPLKHRSEGRFYKISVAVGLCCATLALPRFETKIMSTFANAVLREAWEVNDNLSYHKRYSEVFFGTTMAGPMQISSPCLRWLYGVPGRKF